MCKWITVLTLRHMDSNRRVESFELEDYSSFAGNGRHTVERCQSVRKKNVLISPFT
jgi:hypothetical protein